MSLPRVAFDILTPCDDSMMGAHIAHAHSLGLRQADDAPLQTLTIVANGPSRRLHDPNAIGHTLAVNGALKHFTEAGTAPTYWACCDPQALVADFIPDNPPAETIYLIASKCHPSVFQRLQGRDVRVWDIDDHPDTKRRPRAVSVASSITITAMTLMRQIGYRAFEIYGWDCCFNGEEHHAGQFSDTRPDNFVQVTVGATHVPAPVLPAWLTQRHRFNLQDRYEGGKTFDTTSTWAAEAQDAVIVLHYADFTVNIHGDGMVKAITDNEFRQA